MLEASQINIQSLHNFDRQNKVTTSAATKTNSAFQKIIEKHNASSSSGIKTLNESAANEANNFNNNNSGTDIAYDKEVTNVQNTIIAQILSVAFTAEHDEEAGMYEKFFQPQMMESIVSEGNLELNNTENIYREIINGK